MLEMVVVGHVTLDRIRASSRKRLKWVPGGPAVHTSLTAASLGTETYILSKVGGDFGNERIRWLRQRGVKTKFLKVVSSPTTRFEIEYRNDKRSLRLVGECENIQFSDLPRRLRIRSLHLGPVMNEIPEAVAKSLADHSIITSLDPQGYLRKIGRDSQVLERSWLDRSLLEKVDVLRGSSDELRAISGATGSAKVLNRLRRIGPSVCILTRSGRETDLLSDEGLFRIPAYTPERVVDPTGAGDAFIGAFLSEYSHSRDSIWAACLGMAAASIKVENAGPTLIHDPSRVVERANMILSEVRRIE
jgi:sugar/nucleoside kinase (ribokinase family)